MDRCSKTDRRIYNRDPGIDPPGFRSCFKYIYIYVFRFRGGVSRRKWDFFFLFFFSFFFSARIPRRLIALVIALENYWIATALMLHPSGKWGSLWSSCTDIIIENFKSSWLRRFGSQSCNENSLSLSLFEPRRYLYSNFNPFVAWNWKFLFVETSVYYTLSRLIIYITPAVFRRNELYVRTSNSLEYETTRGGNHWEKICTPLRSTLSLV